MPNRFSAVCLHVEDVVPEVRGRRVHITSRSGQTSIETCMPISAARTLCVDLAAVIGEYDVRKAARSDHQTHGETAQILQFPLGG